jgi:hypothetical protein
MPDFSITLSDRPGEFAKLAARFRQADITLIGLWGYSARQGGEAYFHCVPESAEQFRNFALSAEIQAEEGRAFYLQGSAGSASLVETLDRIAGAGINLRAIQGVRRGDEFGCFIWADPNDWPMLTRLLNSEVALI